MQILLSLHCSSNYKIVNQTSGIPVNSAVLRAFLSNLKYPKNRISLMEKNGELIRLKRDLYVYNNPSISKELIANHLYGISYISLETALAFYGMIPERVYAIRSVTTKRAKTFTTPVGIFEYRTVDPEYFSIGIKQEIIDNQFAFLIATPTKAICDMVVLTPYLRLQSARAMKEYLFDDLRIDFESIGSLNRDVVRQCIETGKKKSELRWLLEI
ncbi:MAG: hypothetical protein BWX49_01542 [Bacteroidetes bacterium ADurb.Bin008]|nr:MAG: hypothetical protein BWX49_01542 [Bacteroidetes bacterium ADurb.Bin008]